MSGFIFINVPFWSSNRVGSCALLLIHGLSGVLLIAYAIGEFRPQADQRSDGPYLQHVKGETGKTRYKAVHVS